MVIDYQNVDFETEVIVLRRHCTWIRWNNAK